MLWGFVFLCLVLLTRNIRTCNRDQTGSEIMSSLQESRNCIDTASGARFPQQRRLSSNSSCMTSQSVSVGRAADPRTLPISHVAVSVKDHAWQNGKQLNLPMHALASREGTLLHLLSMASSSLPSSSGVYTTLSFVGFFSQGYEYFTWKNI